MYISWAAQLVQVVKNPPASIGDPWVGKIPWKKAWQPTPVFLPGESHGQRSLVAYSPKGAKSQIQLKRLSPPTYIFMNTHTYTNGILPSNIKV